MSNYGVRDEMKCDFLHCAGNFDTAHERKVAIIKDGEIMAFCAQHCEQLTENGVALRTLDEVQREVREAKDGPIRVQIQRETEERERVFIAGLKRK